MIHEDGLDRLWRANATDTWSLSGVDAVDRFVTVPSARAFRHALPWRLSSVVATSQRTSDDSPLSKRARDALGVLGLLVVAVTSTSRRLVVEHDGSLVAHLANELGLGSSHGLIMLGPPRANQKPVIQLHDRFGRTQAYVKVGWSDLTRQLLAAEEVSLTTLAAMDRRGFVVPPVLGSGSFGALRWLAIGPLSVRRRAPVTLGGVDALARAVERCASPFFVTSARSTFVARLSGDTALPPIGREVVDRTLDRWSHQEITVAAAHGDFVPWNMLNGRDGAALWDWERFRDDAPIGFDRLHYRIQVGLHRDRRPAADVVRALSLQLDTVLADVHPNARAAHLDWYLTDMLCRYARDAPDDPSGKLTELVGQFRTILTAR